MLQIWDSFIYEGSKVLFRYAIALFKSNEEQLLKLDSHSAVFNQIRRMGKLAYDPQRLSQVTIVTTDHCSFFMLLSDRIPWTKFIPYENGQSEKGIAHETSWGGCGWLLLYCLVSPTPRLSN